MPADQTEPFATIDMTMLRQLTRDLSQRFSWIKEFDTQEQQTISLSSVIASPSLFQDGSLAADRARQARDQRQRWHRNRTNQKDVIRESLCNFEDPVEIPIFNVIKESERRTSLEPVKVTKNRIPHRWKAAQYGDIDGEIFPSDQAYVDMILEHGSSSSWVDFLTIESLSDRKSISDREFCHICTHTIKYNGEPVWKLETRSSCDGKGTWGQSSSCALNKSKGVFRVKFVHKGRQNLGQGWNSRETREYNLVDMIRESGEARAKEMLV